MVIIRYKDIVPVRWLYSWTDQAASSWYYSSSDGRRGRAPSTHTYMQSGLRVSNHQVVDRIRDLLRQEFVCWGYEKTTSELKDQGYIINAKRVYRLMGRGLSAQCALQDKNQSAEDICKDAQNTG